MAKKLEQEQVYGHQAVATLVNRLGLLPDDVEVILNSGGGYFVVFYWITVVNKREVPIVL